MTRKLLSGVLAFAMVFGCTAPVALAEETVVEEVEQYTVYAPSLSKDTVELAKKGDTATVTVSDVADNATVELKGDNAGKFSATLKDRVLTITAEEEVTEQTTLTVKFSSVDSNGAADTYKGTVTLTVKVGTPAKYTIQSDNKGFPEKLTVGKTFETTVFGLKDKEKAGAPTVKVELNDVAQKYFSVSTKNYTENNKVVGTTVVLTAIKAMSEDEYYAFDENVHPAFRATVTYETADQIGPFSAPIAFDDHWYTRTVNDTAKAPQSISMTASTASTTIKTPVTLAAKVMVDDGFGGIVADDDADVVWYINGVKMTDTVHGIENLKGETLAELIPDGDVTAATFTAKAAGTYKITVETADGNCIANKTITVKKQQPTLRDNTLNIAASNDWNKDDFDGGVKVTTPGTTVDLSGIRFAGREADTTGHAIADFGLSVKSYEVLGARVGGSKITYKGNTSKLATTGGTEIASAAFVKNAVSVDENGKVTIADETNEVMKELLAVADGKDITFDIKVTFKDASNNTKYTLWENTPVQVVVTTPSKTADSMDLYLDGKKVDISKSVVLNVGKTYDFDAVVKDAHGYSDAVDQRVVWQIDGNTDKTVYATVDQSGVVTPLQASIETASLKVASITGTAKPVTVKLIIVGEAEKPTTAPTAAPTQAPETKTGTVNTSSSALNIRAAATTASGIVTKAAKGSIVTILGEENGFYQVKLADGTIGYASKAYIKVTTDTPVVTITATTTANLKLRTSAPSGSVITVMPKGATVKVIEGGQSWAKVEYNGKVGYASNNYLTFNTVG